MRGQLRHCSRTFTSIIDCNWRRRLRPPSSLAALPSLDHYRPGLFACVRGFGFAIIHCTSSAITRICCASPVAEGPNPHPGLTSSAGAFLCLEQQAGRPISLSPIAYDRLCCSGNYINIMKHDHWPPRRRRAYTLELIKADFGLARASARLVAVQHLVDPIKRGAKAEAARIAALAQWLRTAAAISFLAIASVFRSNVKPPPSGPLGS